MGFGAPVITRTPVAVPADAVISAYDPIVFEVSWAGDTTAEPITAKRVKAEVFFTSSDTSLGTMKKESILISGNPRYRFNVADMLKTVLEFEFINNISTDVITSGNDKLATEFKLTFTPEYIDSSGVSQTDTSTTSLTYFVGNGIIAPSDSIRSFNASKVLTLTNTISEFLTFAPQNVILRTGEDFQLSFFYLGALQLEINFQTFDLGGNANAEQTVALKTITNKEGTFTISDNGAGTIIDDFTNISKVDVWIEESDGTQISQKKRFIISQECVDGFRLWWSNSLGGVDKFTFDIANNQTFNVRDRINYQQPLDDTPTREEFGVTTLKVTGNDVYTATTRIQAGLLTWFRDLLTSTQAFYQTGPTTIHPINIRTKVVPLDDDDNLIQIDIEFEFSRATKTHIQ